MQLLPRLEATHPGARIRRILWSPEAIYVPYGPVKSVVRRHKSNLRVDHTLPVLYTIGAIVMSMVLASIIMSLLYGRPVLGIGGAVLVIVSIFIMKAVFQQVRKTAFGQFRNERSSLVNGFDFDQDRMAGSEVATINR